MNQVVTRKQSADRIEGNKIILDGEGQFPKILILKFPSGKTRDYKIVKSQFDRLQLNR